MRNADHQFAALGDAAEEAGDYAAARAAFERGVAQGDEVCLTRLARMFDLGLGVPADKPRAIVLYRKAWRQFGSVIAANNIAALHREAGNTRLMFRWFRRAAEAGASDCYLDLAKCYRDGLGVRRSPQLAVLCLAILLHAGFIDPDTEDEARAMLREFRPRVVSAT